MVLTKQRSARHFDITIGKTNIEQVNEIKYLDVIFIDKLSWKSHVQHICSKPVLFNRVYSIPKCIREQIWGIQLD